MQVSEIDWKDVAMSYPVTVTLEKMNLKTHAQAFAPYQQHRCLSRCSGGEIYCSLKHKVYQSPRSYLHTGSSDWVIKITMRVYRLDGTVFDEVWWTCDAYRKQDSTDGRASETLDE